MGTQKDKALASDPRNEVLIAQAKSALRARLRALRMQLPQTKREERSKSIIERITQLALFERAKVVASYAAIDNEVDLTGLHEKAWALGKRIVLPLIEPESGTLNFALFEAGVTPLRNRFGILQPPADASRVLPSDMDCILVPCIAVDLEGYRLGYGHGYYDRFLAEHPLMSVAVAYDFQVLGELPHAAHDQPMRWIVSDNECLKTSAG